MPRLGMEPIRRRALIEAAVEAIGDRGGLDVTMSQIARRAGVSPALAHHYFGAKEQLFVATMRHLLGQFGRSVAAALRGERDPRRRLSLIVAESFAPAQFAPGTVSAWLAFYVHAQNEAGARRLLGVYARRLHANLIYDLRPLAGADAPRIAEGVAALIDGLYIRRALAVDPRPPADAPETAIALVEDYLDSQLARSRA
ncbi:transcriptional regulator BetI [Limibaculum sp. FT325]|uniref:transcriptional regulator BetI n=1 Tax=Thermohalobaculum sediminis TaxID=2939436 RepID=UPI0020BD94B2|nr:transcriptional regulator BetI [Limibaculum sediminis]MCL5778046.1 transcriptional regulator BetI [Limibaculum sediminis]